MNDAGSGNEFVRRITVEVEPGRCTCNGKVNRPHVHAVQNATDHIMVDEVIISSPPGHALDTDDLATLTAQHGFRAASLVVGKGANALEVAVISLTRRRRPRETKFPTASKDKR